MTPNLPATYTIRSAEMGDSQDVLALYHAVSMKIVGEIEEVIEDIEDIEDEWKDPEVDLVRDTRVIHDADGRLIAYGIVNGMKLYPHMDVYLHPDLWGSDPGCEAYLLNWAVERARENLARIPDDMRLALRAYTHSIDERYQRSLEAAGLRAIRHAFQMAIQFDEAPSAPLLPDGFRLRIATQDEDWRPIYEARCDAWRDHFGFVAATVEEDYALWEHYWRNEFDPGLWLLAEDVDAQTIAAICLCEATHNDDETYGWVSTLAVRRAYRQRGLGTLLLQQAFATLHAMGKKSVGLGVDASSITNAVRLYERAGMHVKVRYDLYEIELRPGVETSVTGT
jgi:mycothiol synthase